MRLHDVALRVAHVVAGALRVFDTKQFALGRADADREDAHALLGRLLGGFHRPGIVVLPVREQHQDFVIVAFLESRQRRLNRFRDGRAALGNDIDVERFDALAEGRVVNGQRALQERAAGKRHQAQPVRPRPLHQLERRQLRARQPVGRDVFRQHALRGVNRDHNIQAPQPHFLPIKAPLRPRQRHDQADHRQHQAPRANLLPPCGNAHRQRRQQPCLDELCQQPLPRAASPPEEAQQRRRNRQQQPKHVGIREGQGNLLQRVCRRRISRSSTPRPGEISQANSSL